MIDSRLDARYAGWREIYLGFLVFAIGLEVGAFVVPLWSAHRAMLDQKSHELANADTQLGPRIAALPEQLEDDLPSERRSELRGRLDQLIGDYREADAMPTWPLDQKLRRRVTVGNLVLVVPLIGQAAKLAN